MCRSKSWIEAMKIHAVAEAMVCSKSLASRRFRAECLNTSWFLSLADARDRIEAWRIDYNTERPHSALGHLTPKAFARQDQQARIIS
jgi:transposase InsO family protein